jgi:hypothetical protein
MHKMKLALRPSTTARIIFSGVFQGHETSYLTLRKEHKGVGEQGDEENI